MRTKILLLTAAMTAVTLAPAVGQVFSENVVGFVTKTVSPNGFALISNPLLAADNSINALFSPAPPGTSVFRFNSTTASFITATFDDLENARLPPLGTLEVGDAFFLLKQAAGTWDRQFSVSE